MRLEFQSEDIWRIEAILEAPTNQVGCFMH